MKKIRDEKLQCDINREAAKISALLSDKFERREYLSDEEMLPTDHSRIIEQAKLNYYNLGKSLE